MFHLFEFSSIYIFNASLYKVDHTRGTRIPCSTVCSSYILLYVYTCIYAANYRFQNATNFWLRARWTSLLGLLLRNFELPFRRCSNFRQHTK